MPARRHPGTAKSFEDAGVPNTALAADNPHIVLTLDGPKDLPKDDTEATRAVIERFGNAWTALVKKNGDLSLSKLIPTLDCLGLDEIHGDTSDDESDSVPYRLADFFRIDSQGTTSIKELLGDVRALPGVRLAYVDPPRTPCLVQPDNDPVYASQGYTRRAPLGIGIDAVWPRGTSRLHPDRFAVQGIPGADGAGQELMDVENGFYAQHPDLLAHFLPIGPNPAEPIIGITQPSQAGHGTGVLGVVCATDNEQGCCGIVPHLSIARMASLFGTGGLSCCSVLCRAIKRMSPGAVLLIEVEHSSGSPASALPLEALWPEWLVLRKAWRAGVVVVEAAGNGGKDFAQVTAPEVVDFTIYDSGAIMVGAATETLPHARVNSSNYGRRVNCYAWGQGVATLSAQVVQQGYGVAPSYSPDYRTDFKQTSSAAAIIAGTALSIQGMVSAKFGRRLTPKQMRNLLSDNLLGTQPANPQVDQIGVMPDLERIVARLGISGTSPWWFGAP
jgi:hypothetical protein